MERDFVLINRRENTVLLSKKKNSKYKFKGKYRFANCNLYSTENINR